MIATCLYFLCALSSLACAVLLLRGYARSRSQLLFWSGLCFVCLTISNVFVVVDLVLVKEINFILFRRIPELVGIALLLWGLIRIKH